MKKIFRDHVIALLQKLQLLPQRISVHQIAVQSRIPGCVAGIQLSAPHSCPPDRTMVCPVRNEASSEKRKRTAPRTSEVSQRRPSGTAAFAVSRCRSFACTFIPTDKNDGQMALIAIFSSASSGASSLTVCSSDALASEYAAVFRLGFCVPAVEPRTIRCAPGTTTGYKPCSPENSAWELSPSCPSSLRRVRVYNLRRQSGRTRLY